MVYQNSQSSLKSFIAEILIQDLRLISKSKKSLDSNLNVFNLKLSVIFTKKVNLSYKIL